MDWFDDTTPMIWLVAFWIGCAALLMAGSWLLTRVYPVKPAAPPPPKKKVLEFPRGRPAPR